MNINNINELTQDEIEDILDEANDAYYNTGEIKITDDEFDYIKEFLVQKYPNTKYKNKIGANVKKHKTNLPFHIGSMNKVKTEKTIVLPIELELFGVEL